MRYLLLIARDESQCRAPRPNRAQAMMTEYADFRRTMAERGVLQGGERLRSTSDATTVRVRNGEIAHHRRPLRRDQGAAGRLLPRRLQGPRRGHRGGREDPRRPHRQHRGEADLGDVTAEVEAAVAEAFHAEWGRVVATLVRLTGDWDLAEECAQDAFATALERWPRDGIPRRPGAWLTTVARNRAVDRAPARQAGRVQDAGGSRRWTRGQRRTALTERGGRARRPPPPDVHLLPPGAVVRGAGGADPAHARRHDHAPRSPGPSSCPRRPWPSGSCGPSARSAMPASPSPCRRPTSSWSARPPCWRSSTSSSTRATRPARARDLVRRSLTAEAIRLARVLCTLMPDEPEALGLLALMLFHDARSAARVDGAGRPRGAGRAGPLAVGRRRHRRGARAGSTPPCACGDRALPGPGRHRGLPRQRRRRRRTGPRSPRSTTACSP